MSILSILLIVIIVWTIFNIVKYAGSGNRNRELTLRMLKYGRSIGLFALVTGIFFQLIGLYDAFSVIEQVGDVSPQMLFSGIKVSMISTLYGIAIYLLSLLMWFFSSQYSEKSGN